MAPPSGPLQHQQSLRGHRQANGQSASPAKLREIGEWKESGVVDGGYEHLLSIQQQQHLLTLQRKDSEIAHLKACLELAENQQPEEEQQRLAEVLRLKEEEASLMMAAKHKELELLASLLQLREQQIEDLRNLCEAQQAELVQLRQRGRSPADALTSTGDNHPRSIVEQPGHNGAHLHNHRSDDRATEERSQLEREVRRLRLKMEDMESAMAEQHERSAGLEQELEKKSAVVRSLESQVQLLHSPSRGGSWETDQGSVQGDATPALADAGDGHAGGASHPQHSHKHHHQEAISRQPARTPGTGGGALPSHHPRHSSSPEQERSRGSRHRHMGQQQLQPQQEQGQGPPPLSCDSSDAGHDEPVRNGRTRGNEVVPALPLNDGALDHNHKHGRVQRGGKSGSLSHVSSSGALPPRQSADGLPPAASAGSSQPAHSGSLQQLWSYRSAVRSDPFAGRPPPAAGEMPQLPSEATPHRSPAPLAPQPPQTTEPADGRDGSSWQYGAPEAVETSRQSQELLREMRRLRLQMNELERVAGHRSPPAVGWEAPGTATPSPAPAAAAAATAAGSHVFGPLGTAGPCGQGQSQCCPSAGSLDPDYTWGLQQQRYQHQQHHQQHQQPTQALASGYGGGPAPQGIGHSASLGSFAGSFTGSSLNPHQQGLDPSQAISGDQASEDMWASAQPQHPGHWPQPMLAEPIAAAAMLTPTLHSGGTSPSPSPGLRTSLPATQPLLQQFGGEQRRQQQGQSRGLGLGTSQSHLGTLTGSFGLMGQSASTSRLGLSTTSEFTGWEYRPHASGDPTDAAVAKLVNRPNGRYRSWRALLCRLEQGVYLCGTRRVHLRVDGLAERIEASSDGGKTWTDLEALMSGSEASQHALLERTRGAVTSGTS